MKLEKIIHHVTGHCWKVFNLRGHRSKSWYWQRNMFWQCGVEAHLFVSSDTERHVKSQ